MKRSFALIIILWFMISCTTNSKKLFNTTSISKKKLKEQKILIDSLAARKIFQIYFYAKLKHSDTLVEITDSFWPEKDSIVKTFEIYKDSSDQIVYISERPYHYESSPHLRENYYFDKNGKTFVYEHYEEAEGAAFIRLCYYNNQFDLIALEDSVFDQGADVYTTDSLPLTTKLDFTVSPSYSDYIKNRKY